MDLHVPVFQVKMMVKLFFMIIINNKRFDFTIMVIQEVILPESLEDSSFSKIQKCKRESRSLG